MPISGRKNRVGRRAASQRDFTAFMSESLLSSFPVGSSSGGTGWGFAYKVIDDYSQSSVITLPDESKSFILLNVTYAGNTMYNLTFSFQYENYNYTDHSRPLFLNRSDTEPMYITINLMFSNSSISRAYTISNATNGISIRPPGNQSSVYTWKFHFLVLPFELTRY